MLPNIDPDDRHVRGQDRILVLGGDDLELAVGLVVGLEVPSGWSFPGVVFSFSFSEGLEVSFRGVFRYFDVFISTFRQFRYIQRSGTSMDR
jgi:hypothetical protein